MDLAKDNGPPDCNSTNKDGLIRFLVDLRELNPIFTNESDLIQIIDERMNSLRGAQMSSNPDAIYGSWPVEGEEENRANSAFPNIMVCLDNQRCNSSFAVHRIRSNTKRDEILSPIKWQVTRVHLGTIVML